MNLSNQLVVRLLFTFSLAVLLQTSTAVGQDPWLVFEPSENANGKHVVFVSGDEEYRGEESCPMLAKILSQRHGFKCTVLFSINKETGCIDPFEPVSYTHLTLPTKA